MAEGNQILCLWRVVQGLVRVVCLRFNCGNLLAFLSNQGTDSAQAIQSDDEDESKEPNCLLLEPDFQLMQALMESQQNFTISDPSMADNPIVYASQASWLLE